MKQPSDRDLGTTLHNLQERGYRITGPRRSVLEAAQAWDGSFTAEDIYQSLESSSTPVGRATVFRTLDMLALEGFLDRLHRPDGCHTYVVAQPGDRHHHHLICSDCGAVVQFETCSIDTMLGQLSRETNFRISDHWLEVFGVCSACRS